MKLKSVEITNFRCFDLLPIEFDTQLTVLVARNGQGKSTILDAVRIGLWSFVSGFDLARSAYNDPANAIRIDDVRLLKINDGQMVRQLPCLITVGMIESNLIDQDVLQKVGQLNWTRSRNSEAKGSQTKNDKCADYLKTCASLAQEQIRQSDGEVIDLPVLGYYGTERLWKNKRLTESKKSDGKEDADFFMRLFAYKDCLDPASDYKQFSDWFTWVFKSFREQQIKQLEKGIAFDNASVWKHTILVVQQAIDVFLKETTGWHSLEYSASHENSLILNHEHYGALKVELLSDGIRSVLAMVGDIAYRCIKLNPHLGVNAAKQTQGVILIDEVDMHLHPEWQQSVLVDLTKAFPKIQFIVTTHSPQVISTVPSHQIRILDRCGVYTAEAATNGAESSRILTDVFAVDLRAQNLDIVKVLNRYLALVDDDQWDSDEAINLRNTLDAWSCGHEPELLKADIDIRMKKFQRQL